MNLLAVLPGSAGFDKLTSDIQTATPSLLTAAILVTGIVWLVSHKAAKKMMFGVAVAFVLLTGIAGEFLTYFTTLFQGGGS